MTHPLRATRWLAVAMALAAAVVARGQGMSGGAPPSGGTGANRDPRGGGIPLEEATGSNGSNDQGFGGTSGGLGRGGGTIGAPTRGRLDANPGDPSNALTGPPIGASGTAGFNLVPGRQGQFLGSQLSPLASPLVGAQAGGSSSRPGDSWPRDQVRRDRREVRPPDVDPISLARSSQLALPTGPEAPGPPDGLTLDAAIGLLFRQNLDLMALRYEIPKAEADVLTAGLRNNPLVYADGQLVPYGHYSYLRPGGSGGQPEYDVNFSIPIDVSRKRRARIAAAEQAKKVTEAQLQDSARQLLDDLYQAYVNALAARETVRYTEAYLDGLSRIYDQAVADCRREQAEAEQAKAEHGEGSDEAEKADKDAKAACEAVDQLDDPLRQGRLQLRRAGQVYARTLRTLGLMLNLPPGAEEAIRLNGSLRVLAPLPAPPEAIIQTALASRPDLAAYRLGLGRAQAEVRLARANRYSDIYLVYQPYTLQGGRAFGSLGTYSYAVGVNAALPIFNRNQGNIARAEHNVDQTRVELESRERRVIFEVQEAIRDFQANEAAVLEMERDVLPGSRRARDLAYGQYRDDPSNVYDYLDKQKDYNDLVQEYRNLLIDHRQAMLQVNTAVGVRIFP